MNRMDSPPALQPGARPAHLAGLSVRGMCGWVGGRPMGEGVLSVMLQQLPAAGPAALHVSDRCGLATSDRWEIGRAGPVIVAICGRPDWTQLGSRRRRRTGAGRRFAAAFRSDGTRCLERLGGSFALAAVRRVERRGAARDRPHRPADALLRRGRRDPRLLLHRRRAARPSPARPAPQPAGDVQLPLLPHGAQPGERLRGREQAPRRPLPGRSRRPVEARQLLAAGVPRASRRAGARRRTGDDDDDPGRGPGSRRPRSARRVPQRRAGQLDGVRRARRAAPRRGGHLLDRVQCPGLRREPLRAHREQLVQDAASTSTT